MGDSRLADRESSSFSGSPNTPSTLNWRSESAETFIRQLAKSTRHSHWAGSGTRNETSGLTSFIHSINW
jgi:hypothetical protein